MKLNTLTFTSLILAFVINGCSTPEPAKEQGGTQ